MEALGWKVAVAPAVMLPLDIHSLLAAPHFLTLRPGYRLPRRTLDHTTMLPAALRRQLPRCEGVMVRLSRSAAAFSVLGTFWTPTDRVREAVGALGLRSYHAVTGLNGGNRPTVCTPGCPAAVVKLGCAHLSFLSSPTCRARFFGGRCYAERVGCSTGIGGCKLGGTRNRTRGISRSMCMGCEVLAAAAAGSTECRSPYQVFPFGSLTPTR